MHRLQSKVALITGAASGIGRAAALRFAEEGARVVVADIQDALGEETASTIRAAAGEACFVHADVSRAADAEAMVAAAVGHFGRLDILFNNAGVGKHIPFDALTEAEWDRIVDINLRGVFLGCRYGVPAMRHAGGGAILNTASQSGLQGHPNNQAYCAAKAGVINFTRSLAKDLARHNIRVNAICPGGTDTPILRGYIPAGESADYVARMVAPRTPFGRLARPEEIAAAALFLVSDEASFISGVALPVDGAASA
ncbi:MAG TPA: SDR family NAD(P)-dependent oxidoreductase [Candidatus Margulisiibacteriota bacterium]|nr:SDR family NAD(P)-dependent oxidoreductase [Candidatus Margulisiibacteriota bacterium]